VGGEGGAFVGRTDMDLEDMEDMEDMGAGADIATVQDIMVGDFLSDGGVDKKY